jgi:hypothetical protein
MEVCPFAPTESQSGDNFAAALAIEDNILLVGANGYQSYQGRAFVFEWSLFSFSPFLSFFSYL